MHVRVSIKLSACIRNSETTCERVNPAARPQTSTVCRPVVNDRPTDRATSVGDSADVVDTKYRDYHSMRQR